MHPIVVFLGAIVLVVAFGWIAMKRQEQWYPDLDAFVDNHDLEYTHPAPKADIEGTYRDLRTRISARIEHRHTPDAEDERCTTYGIELPEHPEPIDDHPELAEALSLLDLPHTTYDISETWLELERRGRIVDAQVHERMLDAMVQFHRRLDAYDATTDTDSGDSVRW